MSKQMASTASFTISVPARPGALSDFSNPVKTSNDRASIVGTIHDSVRYVADIRNQKAMSDEVDKVLSTMLPGEKRTVVVTADGGKAKTIINTPGHNVPMIKPIETKPNERVFELTGTLEDFDRGAKEKIGKYVKDGKYDTLPADATFDRAYKGDRERGGDSGKSNSFDPKGFRDFDYKGRDPGVMWA